MKTLWGDLSSDDRALDYGLVTTLFLRLNLYPVLYFVILILYFVILLEDKRKKKS